MPPTRGSVPSWLHWLGVYAVVLLYFSVNRCVAISALLEMFGARDEHTWANRVLGLSVGVLEDWVCATPLVLLLWGFDCCTPRNENDASDGDACGIDGDGDGRRARLHKLKSCVNTSVRFIVYCTLFLVFVLPFSVDMLLVRIRHMRFTFEFIDAYYNAKGAVSLLNVSEHEVKTARESVVVAAASAVVFGALGAAWIDLSLWNPSHLFASPTEEIVRKQYEPVENAAQSPEQALEEGEQEVTSTSVGRPKSAAYRTARKEVNHTKEKWISRAILLLVVPMLVLAVAHLSSPIVAFIALNTTLNEFFRVLFDLELYPGLASADISSAAKYIRSDIEQYTLLKDNVLYRRTTGFDGPLAFDVEIDPKDPPSVLVIAVESFRYHDSQYLVGNNTYLLNDVNITMTPNFDRYAKRGIAFRNMWSSWSTSRSLESILFGQIPYDSIPESGISIAGANVKLSGMPQLFKAKGYERTFVTGARIDYDQWDTFLPAHGFDTVLAMEDVKELAENELGIDPEHWSIKSHNGTGRAMSYWGVHDDISFQVLGNLIMNKTEQQRARVASGLPKKPFFINHYTISSHTPFVDRPLWYQRLSKPDFSPLYEKYMKTHNDVDVRNYLEMRYFQDLALGEFLDRMQKDGTLNDTIVVIVGDHGQAPENGLLSPESRQVSATRVAATILAEGRLGDHAGTMIDDAAEHYDLLNTLADIVGIPETGFLQTGVGRSLKRQIPFGDRVVWSNNPSGKMAAIRGHARLEYDALSSSIALHDTEKDHELAHDLFPSLTEAEQQEWKDVRDDGRHLNLYFKRRWKRSCLTKVVC
uniref:Sulfatase N-terminal domain-containing protein n=1 Tax=Globisporangium ultimum (strain ATCC 200006 / CBS 805.95 / DAOM BR144) TaxID=431595 RepID=K3WVU3_GLOUD